MASVLYSMQRKCKLGMTFLFGAQTVANSTCSEPLHLCRHPVGRRSSLGPTPREPSLRPDGARRPRAGWGDRFPLSSRPALPHRVGARHTRGRRGGESGRVCRARALAARGQVARARARGRVDAHGAYLQDRLPLQAATGAHSPSVPHSTPHLCAPNLWSEIPGCSLSLSRVRSASTPSSVEKVLPPLSDPERVSSDLGPTSHAGRPTITQTPVGLSPPLRLRSHSDRRSAPSPRGLTSRMETRPRERRN